MNFTIIFFEKFLKINNIEMCSTYNEGKSVAVERFIRTLKSKSFKHVCVVSKNVYFDVLDDIADKYNNTVHRSIKMETIDVTPILMLNKMNILMKKILNSKLAIMSEFQNTKTVLLKDTLKISQKNFLL